MLNQVDADVITFEMKSSNMMDLAEVGAAITKMKVGDRRDRPPHAAGGERRPKSPIWSAQALKHIPAERLVLSSDCGMGREGMSRRHAFYKMVALVQGTNIVRKELGLPVAESLGADPKYSLIRS